MKKEIVEQLEEKFSPKFIKKRPGSFGKTLDYIEGHVIVQRLNRAFNHDWSFVVKDKSIHDGFAIVVGQISVNVDGQTIVKDGIGGKKLAKVKADGSFLDIGNDFKDATTDSLKKAATLFGVALDLYGTDEKEEEDSSDEKETPKEAVKDGPATENQKKAIVKMAGTGANLEWLINGKGVVKLNDLTEAQAKEVISSLNQKK
jgi:hypothetical protein